MSAVSVEKLTRDYGGGKGIFDLSFQVDRGEVFGFLGPNGAGKTTTIRHLMGFIKPKAGKCAVDGMDCWTHSAQIQKNLGYIPGEISFFEDMTGRDFLDFSARYRGLSGKGREKELLERFELNPKGKIKKMSKGMKQKIGEVMPQLMAAVGMKPGAASLMGFMISYLYGFILLIFPMLFSILRGNGLIARYVDRGSMVTLVAAPVKRYAVALTQMWVLLSGIFLLVAYSTALELVIAQSVFPGELALPQLLRVNAGLLCLHFCIGGICFLASCVFSDTKYSVGFGAGVPALMYVLQMLANTGDKAETAGYFTLFTLYDPSGLAAGEAGAAAGAAVLLGGAALLFCAGVFVFTKKDLHI